jgi:Pre ATP-grasp domain/PGM1 C-terminal domain
MAARWDDVPEDAKGTYYVLANRLLWSMEDGDIAVIPGRVSDAWLAYITDLLDLASPPTVISLRDYPGDGWYPGERSELAEVLRGLIAGSDDTADPWRLACYIHDRDFAGWERVLGIGAEESVRFAQGTAELVNSKSVFRSMATAWGIPIAEGRVVDHGPELVDCVSELLSHTGAVIIKQDVNAGGDGNILVTTVDEGKKVGAHYVVQLAAADRDTVARALGSFGLTDTPGLPAGSGPAHSIIEVYHPSSRDLSADVFVPRTGAPRLMSYSDLRMAETWKGSIYPPQGLALSLHAHLGAYMQQIAIMAQQLGYYGPMNIDAILTTSGELLFTEFNGRIGGTTGIDTIGRRLLGHDYLDRYVLASQIDVPTPAFNVLAKVLNERGLLFKRGSHNGVVIYNETTEEMGMVEYIVVGRDWEETSHYEWQLKKVLDEL